VHLSAFILLFCFAAIDSSARSSLDGAQAQVDESLLETIGDVEASLSELRSGILAAK